MVNQDQSVRTCILKVDIKCCSCCQNKAKSKLQSISGVSGVEYNEQKGLMIVTGDVEPMTLVRKLTKCGRKTEIVSVMYNPDDDDDLTSDEDDTSSDTSSSPDLKTTSSPPHPKIIELETLQKKMNKSQSKTKCFLFGCFGKKSSRPNVTQPFPSQTKNWHLPSRFELNRSGPAPMMHPQAPMYPMQSAYPPMMMGPAMPYGLNMYRPPPQRTQPYFKTKKGLTINPMHYK